MYCRTCKYQLAGLPEHRCPECGAKFDPADRSTFLRSPHEGRKGAVREIGIIVLVTLLALLVCAFWYFGGFLFWMLQGAPD